ncbi:MAG: short-chain dehydrogenase [Chloroflexota bacterium]|nr:MAG: short-chain dehydrogenase [Chloroflexota bacterium]
MSNTSRLAGKVAVVAGATRGAGRGIALALGAAGATVYATGRSTRGQLSDMGRTETIDDTADLITSKGGKGIAVRVDHTQAEQVKALFERVRAEQNGQLDILVNDVWGGDALVKWGERFWEHSLTDGLKVIERAVFTHLITAHYGAPLMVARGSGLLIEITDGDNEWNKAYRGNLYYDLVKTTINRMAMGMAEELKSHGVTALALTPGFLRSEAMLDHFGVTEANWRDAIAQDPFFAGSETPHFIGQAVVALASDPQVMRKAGQALATWHLAEEYGFNDADGQRPHWLRFYEASVEKQG